MAELLKNSVSSFVNEAAGVAAADVTITLQDASGFPAGGNFRVLCDAEIMLCTARVGDVLTVTRGQEGTVATAHANGSSVSLILTAGAIVQYVSENAGGGGGGSSIPVWACEVEYDAGTFTILDGTGSNLPFDTADTDTHGFHSDGAHPDWLTPPAGGAGLYMFQFEVIFTSTGTGLVRWKINGTDNLANPPRGLATTDNTANQVMRGTGFVYLQEGSSFVLQFQGQGASAVVAFCSLSLVRVAGLPV